MATPITNITGFAALFATNTGALVVQMPDGTTANGNARGAFAVDFSTTRSVATGVASGTRSFVGPAGGTASGTNSTSLNGGTASNTAAFAVGGAAIASGPDSIAMGTVVTVSGTRSVGCGWNVTVAGNGSFGCGRQSNDRGISGTHSFAGSSRAANGDRNLLNRSTAASTSTNTTTTLTTDGAAESTSNTWIIPANYSGIFTGYVVARAISAAGGVAENDSIGWKFEGMVSRDTAANTVTLLGTATPTLVGTADASMATCTLAVTVNTTNGSLIVQGTGIAATSIAWNGWINCAENG